MQYVSFTRFATIDVNQIIFDEKLIFGENPVLVYFQLDMWSVVQLHCDQNIVSNHNLVYAKTS